MVKTYCHVKEGFVVSTVISKHPITKMDGHSLIELEGEEREAAGSIFVTTEGEFYAPEMVEVTNEAGNSFPQRLFDEEKKRIMKSDTKIMLKSKIMRMILTDEEQQKLALKLADMQKAEKEKITKLLEANG